MGGWDWELLVQTCTTTIRHAYSLGRSRPRPAPQDPPARPGRRHPPGRQAAGSPWHAWSWPGRPRGRTQSPATRRRASPARVGGKGGEATAGQMTVAHNAVTVGRRLPPRSRAHMLHPVGR